MDIGSFISGAVAGMAVETIIILYIWLWREEKGRRSK